MRTLRQSQRSPRSLRHALLRWGLAVICVIPSAVAPAAAATTPTGNPKVISDWNAIAVNTVVGDTTKTGHPQVILYMGFVQAAMYDAVVGVDGGYEPYRFEGRAP